MASSGGGSPITARSVHRSVTMPTKRRSPAGRRVVGPPDALCRLLVEHRAAQGRGSWSRARCGRTGLTIYNGNRGDEPSRVQASDETKSKARDQNADPL